VYEASGLGAAMVAAVGAGVHPDFDSAVKDMTHLADTFEPNPKTREIYDQLYSQIYTRMYPRLQPFYRFMQKLDR
jgi:sugar (pentulose or hexulose) kinase